MKTKILLCVFTLHQALCCANSQTPEAAPDKPASAKSPATPAAKAKVPRYKPPVKDAPSMRQDGGTRGPNDTLPLLFVLTPNHVALTTQEQPSLFWYQSQPTKVRFEITVTEPNTPKPVLALKAGAVNKAGIRRIKLSDHKVALKPGVEYRWSIALVPDPNSRSRDAVASGAIKRVESPQELRGKIDQSSLADRAFLYAQGGFWYDALESISDLIDAHPEDRSLRAQRAALLDQVKLPEPATFDRTDTKAR